MSNKIFIGGGTGTVGRALGQWFKSKGYLVNVITRNPKRDTELSWNDIRTSGLPDDVNVVVNLAGRSIGEVDPRYCLPGPNKAYMDEIYSSRIDTTKLLTSACQSVSKLKTFICASAIGIYPTDLEATFTESHPFKQVNFLTNLVHSWEEAAKSLTRPEVANYQLRLGVVLSPNSNFIRSLQPSHRLGLGGPIGSGRQWISWIHLDDVVGIVDFLVSSSNLSSGPINVTSPYPTRQAQLSKALMEALGAPRLPFGPYPTPKVVFRAMLGPERSVLVLEGQRVLPDRLLKAGYVFKHPRLEQSLQAIYGRNIEPVPED